MISKHLQDQLSLLMARSTMKSKYASMDFAEKHGITPMSTLTLTLFNPGKSESMKAISNFIGCDPSNVTGIVEQLVKEGLVLRKEAEYDRRVKTVTLTKKGIGIRSKFLELIAITRLPNLTSLSEQETMQLITILKKATSTSSTDSISDKAAV